MHLQSRELPQSVLDFPNVEYTKEKQIYRNLVPSGHTLLTFCIRICTFDCFRVYGVQVFRVSCIIVTKVRVQKVNMDH